MECGRYLHLYILNKRLYYHMRFCDTHVHLNSDQFSEDSYKVIERALNDNIDRLFIPNVDVDTIERMHALCDQYPKYVFPMMGLHPCHVKDDFEAQLKVIEGHLRSGDRRYYAVGEIGIDLHWDKSTLGIQQEAFRRQIAWAKELDLPIVIHARESFDELFEIVDELNDERLRGVFHCFTGTKEQAEHIIAYGGFKMGIGGVFTFKNSPVPEAIKDLSLDHFVLETDAPYLAPTPFRGKRNEPSYLLQVAIKMSQVFGVSIKEIADMTTANAYALYAFSD